MTSYSNENSKTIWYISKYAYPIKYFFGTRHFYLGAEWVKQGHKVYILSSSAIPKNSSDLKFKGKYFVEIIEGINTIWLKTLRFKRSDGFLRILSWLHFEWQLLTLRKRNFTPPDVVIVSSLSLLTIINGILLKRKYKAKLIFEVRDIWPLSLKVLGGYSDNNLIIKFLGWIEKVGYLNSDVLVGTMPNFCEHVSNIIDEPKKCICIPQGFSTDFYLNNNHRLSEDYIQQYIPKEKYIVCYIGTLNRNNPIQDLLKIARLVKNDSEIHFVILGSGYLKEELEQQALDLDNVSFPPVLDKRQINHFLSFVDVCFDAFDSELAKFGLSRNKWIDYMYAGKPIICYFSGFESMINEADCGDFVEFGNLDALYGKIMEYRKIGKEESAKKGLNGQNWLLKNRSFDILADEYAFYFK